MHFGCFLKRKKIKETEEWRIVSLLEEMTEEGIIDWNFSKKTTDRSHIFETEIEGTRFSIRVGFKGRPPVSLMANYADIDICWCFLVKLVGSVALTVRAKQIAQADREKMANHEIIKNIRLKLESGDKQEPNE